ncbi:NOL1/NOP2/sun family putative RNA methylase [Candidatus Micrarchaeota archaeon]|nr:NOL1/NOP2/sun family putative RNA methylase [Candidatus Micrarchaeota archaeon]
MEDFNSWLSQYTDADSCISSFCSQKQFFRVNTIKTTVEKFTGMSRLKFQASSHCNVAFEYQDQFQIGKTWEYFLGYIYPQSLPSILVSAVLNPGKNDIVLDVAAAPGSKFSHIAMSMENRGVLVGNDYKKEKISALYSTINRMNILNCIVTMRDGKMLDWKERFTRVLLDAPCTALGSGPSAGKRWEPDHSKQIASTQKKMLFSAYDALKPGGEMVYSTCTYPKEENEDVVSNLLENTDASLLDVGLDVPHEHGLAEYGHEFRKTYRIYPQHLQSEGFFIAKIRKGSQ